MDECVVSRGGETWYLTEHAALKILEKGCPHCGSTNYEESAHPEHGGTFWRCINDCRNVRGAQFYVAFVRQAKRRKDLRVTHPWKAGGFPTV